MTILNVMYMFFWGVCWLSRWCFGFLFSVVETAPQPSGRRPRFAIYCRYSADMQNELSLEDQEKACRKKIAEMGGVVIGVYKDGAQSGWNLDRSDLNRFRADAGKGKFDAAMFWKFDRLMRDHDQTVVVKLLLRREYGLKLYCVEGFSEDEDDSPYTAMMEQMLAIFSAFYSKNLSIDTKRAKRSAAERGEFNGSIAPLGYTLVTKQQAQVGTLERGLHIDPCTATLVRILFDRYATGRLSDGDLATFINRTPLGQRLRLNEKPFDKESVRVILQNRVYVGQVSHSDTQYSRGLGQGRKSNRHRKEWFEGKHQALISVPLFDECQQVRQEAASHHKRPQVMRTYIAQNKVYCARCTANRPQGLNDERYGKMGAYFHTENGYALYRCKCAMRGYASCGQSQPRVDDLDNQLVTILTHIRIPADYRRRIEEAVSTRVEHETAFQRMRELEAIVKRMDFRFDQGLVFDWNDFVQQRTQLLKEIESLRPIDYDYLNEAVDLLANFRAYWEGCATMDHPDEARKQLVDKIVDRIFVDQNKIVGLVLYGDFAVLLDGASEQQKTPDSLSGALATALGNVGIITVVHSQIGTDGHYVYLSHVVLPCVSIHCIIILGARNISRFSVLRGVLVIPIGFKAFEQVIGIAMCPVWD